MFQCFGYDHLIFLSLGLLNSGWLEKSYHLYIPSLGILIIFFIAEQTTWSQNMPQVIHSLSETTFSHKFWTIYPTETQSSELAVLTAFTLLKSMNSTGFKPPTLWSLHQPLTHKNYAIHSLSKLCCVDRKSLDLLAQRERGLKNGGGLSLNGWTTCHTNICPVWFFIS